MDIIDVYDEKTWIYMGSFKNTNQNIINYVASLLPYEHRRFVDASSDQLLLTTIGNFLDYVPNQEWLKEIQESLIRKQLGYDSIEQVNVFNRFELEEECRFRNEQADLFEIEEAKSNIEKGIEESQQIKELDDREDEEQYYI
ncbi:hypothetical protein IGJ51_000345 [Enterococcus sp. DIV0802c]|uniref:hypothetical protein n=1 Tax=Enterococcus sp. DIV0802c TaxID=2774743 RepID=UPI003F2483A9